MNFLFSVVLFADSVSVFVYHQHRFMFVIITCLFHTYALMTTFQISESCDPKIRGVLGSLPSIMMSLGILFAYVIGSFVRWNVLGWVCSAFPVSFLFMIWCLPESPVWLESKNRFHEANSSMNWLKLEAKNLDALEEKPNSTENEKVKLSQVFFTRPILMPVLIGFTLLVLQQISGIDTVIFFTVEIFRSSGKLSLTNTNSQHHRTVYFRQHNR